MHPRCWLPRRSRWLEHNHSHDLSIFLPCFLVSFLRLSTLFEFATFLIRLMAEIRPASGSLPSRPLRREFAADRWGGRRIATLLWALDPFCDTRQDESLLARIHPSGERH